MKAAVMMRKSQAQTKLGQGTEARQHEVPVWCWGTGLGGQGKGHDKGADRVQAAPHLASHLYPSSLPMCTCLLPPAWSSLPGHGVLASLSAQLCPP